MKNWKGVLTKGSYKEEKLATVLKSFVAAGALPLF